MTTPYLLSIFSNISPPRGVDPSGPHTVSFIPVKIRRNRDGYIKLKSYSASESSSHIMSSSNQLVPLTTSKSASIQIHNTSPSQPQPNSSFTTDNNLQRRSGGTGSFGAGSTSRVSPAAARNSQSSKKQHKNQRRPRLADEDAAAESVSHGYQPLISPH